jgi:hypothetical protein
VSITKIRKRHLRECARIALEIRGFRVELKAGAGIVPGARLRMFHGSKAREVAVRTSLDREVGFTRHPDGRWTTIPSVDEVVVAVPSAEDPSSAEVLSFDREVIIDACNAALAARKNEYPELSHKAPIFIALDTADSRHSSDAASSGLKAKAKWRTSVPLAAVRTHKSPFVPPAESFIERVKREFAELNGVDVSKVVVEFRIIA